MEKMTYDKTQWAKGEWDNEPDRVDFVYASYACFIQRNNSGAWCGYVGVPSTHPKYGVDYNDVNVEVHGGLTYGEKCRGVICHVPEPGMPDDVWWLGFDCAHAFDTVPGMVMFGIFRDGEYRNQEYATHEVMSLADQLKAMENAETSEPSSQV